MSRIVECPRQCCSSSILGSKRLVVLPRLLLAGWPRKPFQSRPVFAKIAPQRAPRPSPAVCAGWPPPPPASHSAHGMKQPPAQQQQQQWQQGRPRGAQVDEAANQHRSVLGIAQPWRLYTHVNAGWLSKAGAEESKLKRDSCGSMLPPTHSLCRSCLALHRVLLHVSCLSLFQLNSATNTTSFVRSPQNQNTPQLTCCATRALVLATASSSSTREALA